MLLVLLCMGCFGCNHDASQQPNQQEQIETNNEVYVVHDSSRTTNEWDMKYGAIKADGTMVLPMEYSQVIILEDLATGEPLYLRTYELTLKEGVAATKEMAEAMRADYYSDMSQDASQYFCHEYKLYDMDGDLVKEMGSEPVYQICGDLVRYKHDQLIHHPSGKVLFDNADIIRWAEGCYIIVYDQYQRVCVMDPDLNVLLDIEGHEGFTAANGVYYLITEENGKRGLCRLDGTQVVPNEYDYLISYYSYAPYVQAQQGDTKLVLSLEDGHIVYQNSDEYDYIQELFPDFMIVQEREEIANTDLYPSYRYYSQFYDYNGEPMGGKYLSLTPQNDFYKRTQEQKDKGMLIFQVTDEDGRKYLMNENEEELYTLTENQWASMLTEDCIIVNDSDAGHDMMCRLDGTVLTQKEYDSINQLYLPAKDDYYSTSELVAGYYQYNNVWLTDVLDADGNIILERLKAVEMLSNDLFWVEKGFDQGLMDRDGSWVYKQSLFDGAADE